MRYFFAIALLGLSVFQTQAQTIDPAKVQTEAEALIQTYQLTAEQESEAYTIAERRLRNLSEIAHLENQNRELFLQKKDAIRKGTLVSLKRLLTEAQRPILQEQIVERRKRESDLIQRMKAQGADRKAIQLAVWALD